MPPIVYARFGKKPERQDGLCLSVEEVTFPSIESCMLPTQGTIMNKKVKKRMIITVSLIVFHMLGFLSSIHAVMSTRTSQGAIAWVVSLNTFPYVAVSAYWVFGRSTFRGYATARQTGDLEIQHIVRTASAESVDLRSTAVRTGATRAAEQLAEMPAVRGNTVELLIDGDATFVS